MTHLQGTLLGAFELATCDRAPIRIETRKARALLAILIMARGQPVQRERLAGLLWSRGETRQALASLSQAVYSLRRALHDAASDAIRTETDTLAIERGVLSIDVWDLEAAAARNDEAGWRRCVELYGGGFLDDVIIDTEEAYSEWRAAERARLEGLVAGAGTALMTAWEKAPEAADKAMIDRLLAIDAYNEPAVRVRMILLARDGRQAAAIAAGEAFADLLSSDLGLTPSEQLAAVAARIRAGDETPTVRGPVERERPAARGWPGLLGLAAAVLLGVVVLWAALARDTRPPEVARLFIRPFEAGSGIAPELARGFSDDLSTELVRRSGLDVLSRESGRLIAVDDDAASGASHVLRGRMRAEADRWILNVWITETGSDREVWAERFRASADAPRVVRDEIVARISSGIGLALVPLPEIESVALPQEAVPDYLRALSQLHSGTAEGNAEAIGRLRDLAASHPEVLEPVAALVLAFERVAFEADDFARAAELHWLEGYLMLKRTLATVPARHPDLLAARARLALRRLDHASAQALARQALEADDSNVGALEVLARSLALAGETEAARRTATRAITLSPAAPEDGYTSLALAAFAEGDMAAATGAVEAALDSARRRPLQLLTLRAAILGLEGEESRARASFEELVAAVESRPFGAWRLGDLSYSNPRAATWRRPTAAEASSMIRFTDPSTNARLRQGLVAASGQDQATGAQGEDRPLSDVEIEELLFGRRIVGQQTWLVQQEWSQSRTADGVLFQDGTFGPLPGAREGRSHTIEGRLCDRWVWQETEIENCQLVVPAGPDGLHAFIGETGYFPFRVSEHMSARDQ